jgi:hypothetical protein
MGIDQSSAAPAEQITHLPETLESISQRTHRLDGTLKPLSPAAISIFSTQAQVDDSIPWLPGPRAGVGNIKRVEEEYLHEFTPAFTTRSSRHRPPGIAP